MDDYPKRDPFFSHKFVRLLQKGCVSQDIGRDAVLLLCFIVHQEDAAKYSQPVRFWNEQLMNTMGFKSPKQLNNAREAAIKAGWLRYWRTGNRQVGYYFVTVPTEFEGFPDSPIEHNHSVNHSAGGTNTERNAERIGDELRNEKVTDSGKHSNPGPAPNPGPEKETNSNASNLKFPQWWSQRCSKQFDAWQSIVAEKHFNGVMTQPSLDAALMRMAHWDEERWFKALAFSTEIGSKTLTEDTRDKRRLIGNGQSKPSPQIKIVSLPTVNPKHLAEQQRLDREAAEKAKTQQ